MCLDEALFTVVPPVLQEDHEKLKNKLGAVEAELKSTLIEKNKLEIEELELGELDFQSHASQLDGFCPLQLNFGEDLQPEVLRAGLTQNDGGSPLEEDLREDFPKVMVMILSPKDFKPGAKYGGCKSSASGGCMLEPNHGRSSIWLSTLHWIESDCKGVKIFS